MRLIFVVPNEPEMTSSSAVCECERDRYICPSNDRSGRRTLDHRHTLAHNSTEAIALASISILLRKADTIESMCLGCSARIHTAYTQQRRKSSLGYMMPVTHALVGWRCNALSAVFIRTTVVILYAVTQGDLFFLSSSRQLYRREKKTLSSWFINLYFYVFDRSFRLFEHSIEIMISHEPVHRFFLLFSVTAVFRLLMRDFTLLFATHCTVISFNCYFARLWVLPTL